MGGNTSLSTRTSTQPDTQSLTVVSAQPPALRTFLWPPVAVRDLWRHRALIVELTRAELLTRYKGSVLGILWAFVNPLLLLTVYTFVFSVILRARWPGLPDDDPLDFALILFGGLLVFSFVSECLSRAPMTITAVPNYVKKVVFPLQVLPVVVVVSALFNSAIGFSILALANLILTGRLQLSIVFLPIVLLPALLLAIGLSWLLASIGVFIRDIGIAIGFAIQILFFLTPIFYPIDVVPLPWRLLLQINPLALVVQDTRGVVVSGALPDFFSLLILSSLTGVVAMLGYAVFMRTRSAFADAL